MALKHGQQRLRVELRDVGLVAHLCGIAAASTVAIIASCRASTRRLSSGVSAA